MDKNLITRKQASVYVLAELKKLRTVSLVGTIGLFVITFAGVMDLNSFVLGALMFPVVLFMAYNYMTAKSNEEGLKAKYHDEPSNDNK